MPVLYVKEIPAPIYEGLKRRAEASKRSVASEVRHILEKEVRQIRSLEEIAQSIETIRTTYRLSRKGPSIHRMIADDRRR
jgi:hypothetical protein